MFGRVSSGEARPFFVPAPFGTTLLEAVFTSLTHLKLENLPMNVLKLLIGATLLPLAACGGNGDDKAAAEVEQAFENKADQLDAAAENASGAVEERLEDEAEVYRETGEAAAEAIDDVDLDTEAADEETGQQATEESAAQPAPADQLPR